MSDWHNVSKSEPCPICHKTDWCNLSNDGAVCICHRVESPYPARSGSGWIHRLKEVERKGGGGERWPRFSMCYGRARTPAAPISVEDAQNFVHHSPPPPSTSTYTLNFSRIHASYDADPVLIEGLATSLGVDDLSLKAMDVRFNRMDECWSFPMRDADGKIVGLRFRELGGSKKWSARGSHDGLFYVDAVSSPRQEMVIVEGPSDTAALLSLFNQQLTTINQQPTIVGRSSCQTGSQKLRQYIRRVRPRYITIVADNDTPGIRGADLLASQLKQSNNPNNQTAHPPMRVLVVPYPYKDVRAWYVSGRLTAKVFADMVSAQQWC